MASVGNCARFAADVSGCGIHSAPPLSRPLPERSAKLTDRWTVPAGASGSAAMAPPQPLLPFVGSPVSHTGPQEVDPFYLFACYVEWEQHEDPDAAWELIAAAQSTHCDTRAHALALLAGSRHLGHMGDLTAPSLTSQTHRLPAVENEMKPPYGLDIVDNCTECSLTNRIFFCGCSSQVREALDEVSHKSILPAGAILFVEGQAPRGVFIVCSGKVNISTASRDGKVLVLKTANAGEALGLSAAISGVPYEITAETATPCQLSFVARKHFLELIESHGETGAHAARSLSRDYQTAYRDIRDLILTRSSAGKLARLLLSQSPRPGIQVDTYVTTPMTHEEMAQRIGSSRETVTRLLSDLRKKRLIRVDGSSLIIQDRTALEALAV